MSVGRASSVSHADVCLACGGSTSGLQSSSDGSAWECACAGPGATTAQRALVETTATGALLPSKECLLCPPGTLVYLRPAGARRADPYACVSCDDPNANITATGTCECAVGYRAAGLPELSNAGLGVVCLPVGGVTTVTASYPEAGAAATEFRWLDPAPGTPPRGPGYVLTLTSRVTQHLYLQAAVGCHSAQPGSSAGVRACQALANLCVLALYAPSHPACGLYTQLANVRRLNPALATPTLLHDLQGDAVKSDGSLKRQMSFGSPVTPASLGAGSPAAAASIAGAGASDSLEVILAAYALNGTFLGLQRLTDQLHYCGTPSGALSARAAGLSALASRDRVLTGLGASGNGGPSWLRFGASSSVTLQCDLTSLALTADNGAEMVLFDAYIRDAAADGPIAAAAVSAALGTSSAWFRPGAGARRVAPPVTLVPMPVRLMNYRSADGSRPNDNGNVKDEVNDVFVRRFTLWDAASGTTDTGAPPQVIRYAASLTISVPLRAASDGRLAFMAPPILTINYTERLATAMLLENVSPAAAAGVNRRPDGAGSAAYAWGEIVIAVEYVPPSGSFWTAATGLAVTLAVCVALCSCVRVAGWTRRNARTEVEATLGLRQLAQLLLAVVSGFGASFFWLTWLLCLYFLVGFKLHWASAGGVPVIPPPDRPMAWDNDYNVLAGMLIALFACQLARVASAALGQARAEVYLIDWASMAAAACVDGKEAAGAQNSGDRPDGSYTSPRPQITTASYSSGAAVGGGTRADYRGASPAAPSPGTARRGSNASAYAVERYAGLSAAAGPSGSSATAAGEAHRSHPQGSSGRACPTSSGSSDSGWRSILVAREWARLGSSRRLCLPAVLAAVVLLLEGFGLKYVATCQPDRFDLTPGALNPALQFANTVLWFLIVAGSYLAVAAAIEHLAGTSPASALLDLCAHARMGLLIADSRYRAFYIHGAANPPAPAAGKTEAGAAGFDGQLAAVAGYAAQDDERLRDAQSGSAPRRGSQAGTPPLLPGRALPDCPDQDAQCCEVHLPLQWRDAVTRLFTAANDAESALIDAALRADGDFPPDAGRAGPQQYGQQPMQQQFNTQGWPGVQNSGQWQQHHQQQPMPYGGRIPGPVRGPSLFTGIIAAARLRMARMRERAARLHGAQAALATFLRAFLLPVPGAQGTGIQR